MPNQIERQWKILHFLPRRDQGNNGKTVTEILQYLSSEGIRLTDRTVQRDLNELSCLMPIDHDGDNPPRWRFTRDARHFDIPNLSYQEAQAFMMLRHIVTELLPMSSWIGLGDIFIQAEQKIKEAEAQGIAPWHEKIAILSSDQPYMPPRVANDVLYKTLDALERGKKVSYKKRPTRLDNASYVNWYPLALIKRDSILYLIAKDEAEQVHELPLYKLFYAYIFEDCDLGEYEFSLSRYLKQQTVDAEFPRRERLRLSHQETDFIVLNFYNFKGDHLQFEKINNTQQYEEFGNDGVRISLHAVYTPEFKRWVLGFGADVEVIEPRHIREDIAQTLYEMQRRY